MKKYFIMAVAVLASLTACQKDPEQIIVNDGTIKFMSAPVTRAEATPIVDLSTFQNSGKSFTVYGFTETDIVFDGIQPLHSQTGEGENAVHTWTPETTTYWADAKHYNFYAFYNQGENTNNSFAYDKAVIKFDATSAADKDFVMASNCNILGNVFNAPVQLNFRHQLSRVAIKFVNKFNDLNMTITVSDVKVYAVPTGAKFTYTAPTGSTTHNPSVTENAEVTTSIEIADADKKDVSFEFQNGSENDGIIVGVAENVTTYNSETTIYKYFVPTAESVEYYMSCRVKFTTATKTGATDLEINKLYGATEKDGVVTCDNTLKLNRIQYVAGQGYIFTANIYDTVNPITFSVAVEDWKDNTVEGTIEIGNR